MLARRETQRPPRLQPRTTTTEATTTSTTAPPTTTTALEIVSPGQPGTFFVTDYGATADAKNDDTPAFQAAVDAAAEEGGVVDCAFRLGQAGLRAQPHGRGPDRGVRRWEPSPEPDSTSVARTRGQR